MTNILQHKSWHVWNRDNRAKVERDVAAHKESEEKKRKRVLEIEQEIRYNQLKDKNKKRKEETQGEDDDPDSYKRATAVVPYKESREGGDEKPQHINFFADIEAGQGQIIDGDKNADYEAEKKAEKEKEDRKNTNYLVPPQTSDFKVVAPWYAKVPTESKEVALPEPQKTDKEAQEEELKKKKDERRKNKEDPLQAMNKFLGAKKTSKKIKKEQEREESKASSIAKMREDRLKREAEERKKVSQLLYGNKDQKSTAPAPASNSSGYNNSFLGYSGGIVRDPQYRSRSNNDNHRSNRY